MVRLSVVLAGEREFYKNISYTSAVSSTNFGSIDYSSLQAALLVLVIYYVGEFFLLKKNKHIYIQVYTYFIKNISRTSAVSSTNFRICIPHFKVVCPKREPFVLTKYWVIWISLFVHLCRTSAACPDGTETNGTRLPSTATSQRWSRCTQERL